MAFPNGLSLDLGENTAYEPTYKYAALAVAGPKKDGKN